jgi:hypothetical protein
MSKLISILRNADFLTRERMTIWSAGCVIGFSLGILFLFISAHGLNDYAGRPLGSDFSNVYAAGVATLHGNATAPFDIVRQQQQERAIFGANTQLYGWHYPPFFLLIAALLAELPYIFALVLWQLVTLLLYLVAMWLLLHNSAAPRLSRDPLWLLLALGFTAVFLNFTHGQNGFLTAALFASALALLDTRRTFAGILLGLLCYKPQFAVVIPLVLVATGRWRTFISATATVLAAATLVTWLFGVEIWPAFVASSHFTRQVILEQGATGFYKIQSAFAVIRLWGGGILSAYLAQAVTAILVLVGLVHIWRGNIPMGYKGAALCLSALLVTPYSLDYDLMLLAPVIALLAAEGTAHGFRDFERLVLVALWIIPIFARTVAHYTLIPLTVPALALCLAQIYRRSRAALPLNEACRA